MPTGHPADGRAWLVARTAAINPVAIRHGLARPI